ncbi:MAG: GNAT family N-acetyltransferase [Actinomycetota bacterium]
MDPLLELFDREVRRAPRPPRWGIRSEIEPNVHRTVGVDGMGWCGVDWSNLDESNADEVIAREVEYFGRIGRPFEWKYFDYDTPADLERRLIAAGFTADDDESVMIGEIATLPRSEPPNGVQLIDVTNAGDIERMIKVHEEVFAVDHSSLRNEMLHNLEAEPGSQVYVLSLAGDEAVSASRMEFVEGSMFASLWGGGTLKAWRGRGIYRAMVSHRADLAAARGYKYLYVDASEDSRPILERLGFRKVARTTPYTREPDRVPT